MKGHRYKKRGWFNEPHRHYLAAKGIKTARSKGYENSLPAIMMQKAVVSGARDRSMDGQPFMGVANAIEDSFNLAAGKKEEVTSQTVEFNGRNFAKKGSLVEWLDISSEFPGRLVNVVEELEDGRVKIKTNRGEIFIVPEDEIKEVDFMASKVLPNPPKKTILTAQGEAEYVKTELEDEMGNWNDNYFVRDGFFVLHRGDKHHVYKVNKRSKAVQDVIDQGNSLPDTSFVDDESKFMAEKGAAFGGAMNMGAGIIPSGEEEKQEEDMTLNFIPGPEDQMKMQNEMQSQTDANMMQEEENTNSFFAGKKNTLFFPPENQKVAEMISLKDPSKAKQSAQMIIDDFDTLQHEDAMRQRIRATTLAANRARAQLKRENLSSKEREEFKKIAKIYDTTQETLSNRFEEMKMNGEMN